MPNRMLRDWTGSDKVNKLTVNSERFFVRLIMKVDDFGCFYADPRLLKANLFPLLLDNIRDADILRWMDECQKAGLIVVYENSSKRYCQILDFKQRLDRAKNKYPLPSDNDLQAFVNVFRAEENRTRTEPEVEEKGREFPLAECKLIALRDPRWIKANSTSEKELDAFNVLLEKRGHYDKNPADYKSHFANWKLSGKKESELPDHMKKSENNHLKSLN